MPRRTDSAAPRVQAVRVREGAVTGEPARQVRTAAEAQPALADDRLVLLREAIGDGVVQRGRARRGKHLFVAGARPAVPAGAQRPGRCSRRHPPPLSHEIFPCRSSVRYRMPPSPASSAQLAGACRDERYAGPVFRHTRASPSHWGGRHHRQPGRTGKAARRAARFTRRDTPSGRLASLQKQSTHVRRAAAHRMLYMMVSLNRTVSCGTTAMTERRDACVTSRTSWPSTRTAPARPRPYLRRPELLRVMRVRWGARRLPAVCTPAKPWRLVQRPLPSRGG